MTWERYYSSLRCLPERLKKPVPFVVEAVPDFRRNNVSVIFDLGCGAGRHCVYLAQQEFGIVGIDLSKASLKIAKEWIRKERLPNVQLVRGVMTHVPFKDNCFDAVISVSVIHHAMKSDIIRTIEEIHRILRAGGLFLANLVSVEDCRYGKGVEVEKEHSIMEEFKEYQLEELHHFFTRDETSRLLANFSKVNIEHITPHHHYWEVTAVK